MNIDELERWLEERGQEDDLLYERFGRPLEPEHNGEYVAISDDGLTILGADELTVSQQALERFGSGQFALRKVGARAELRWRAFKG